MTRRFTASRAATAMIAGMAAGLILSACGTDPQQGEASPDKTTAATDTGSTGEAPRVVNPVDTAALQQDPCAALSDAQAAERNLERGVSEELDGDPSCIYRYTDDSGSRVRFAQNPDLTNGLDDLYAQKDTFGLFEEAEVAGQPAVFTSQYDDDRDEGFCYLQLGLTDNEFMSVMVSVRPSSDDYPQGCDVAEAVAGDMIEHLRGGA
ncbi:DUF3558 domain-containing protein [Saccharomonospora sp. CUA-673]|uniref:DUF3558 domain-containing protein n=1 Tax=Saccharomonospora sp. CUA-673 TaxID=1904969 RepID=UPI0011153F51|nr:DUF3558 domain-containing protein [Saccharomonospora sp. CUA-673]